MTQINACEFMIKGYHYTELTNPSRTDSCKLYLDTEVDPLPTQSSSFALPITAYMDNDISTLCHLKGFHNFYVKN